jgi:hypothetical protein
MGWLSDTISKIQLLVDEPDYKAKYTDSDLIDLIESEWTDVVEEMFRMAQNTISVRHEITFQRGTQYYVLPPTVGEITRLAERDATTHDIEFEMTPRSPYNPYGPNFTIEGNMIVLDPKWQGSSKTLELEYIPTGDVRLHDGTLSSITNSTTVVLPASPTTGTLDTRPNAYAGSVFRVLSATTNDYIQERVIKSYDVTTRTATLSAALDPVPSGTITYEIAPMLALHQAYLVAFSVARTILAVEGDNSRYSAMNREYQRKIRNLRLRVSNFQTIRGTRMETDTRSNERTHSFIW